ncbi:MAG: DUF4082 domain-containing protein, partial [Nitrospira sp.]|nr:DUF4082 domain-containing protein [Nitrospira sp.]
MIARQRILVLGLAALFTFASLPEPSRAAVVTLSRIDFEFDGSPWTLGWRFAVHEPVFAEALGVYDSGQDGLAGSAEAALWLATGGAPLVQVTIPAGTDATLDGSFRFVPIASILLHPGTDYVIGSYLPGELSTSLFGDNGVVDPLVTVIEARYSAEWTGFAFPAVTEPESGAAAFLGANLRIAP